MATETKAKHTPGPWTVVDGQEVVRRASIETLLIAQCHAGHREERGANSRLIAAAPDLLKAARRAAKVLGYWTHSMAEEPREQLRAAIAKAEGGAA